MLKYWLLAGCVLCFSFGCKEESSSNPSPAQASLKASSTEEAAPDDSEEKIAVQADASAKPTKDTPAPAPDTGEQQLKEPETPEKGTPPEETKEEPAVVPVETEGEEEEKPKAEETVPESLDKKAEEKSDLEKTIVGPDGPAEPKENSRFGPSFPPKDSQNKKVPEEVKGMVMDPRIAPDSNADFDENRVPLGRSSDEKSTGLSSIPRALVFYPLNEELKGLVNSQGVRISAVKATSLQKVRIDEPQGPFQFKKPVVLPMDLKEGAGAIIEIECAEGADVHETTLTLESSAGTLVIPLRYFPTAP